MSTDVTIVKHRSHRYSHLGGEKHSRIAYFVGRPEVRLVFCRCISGHLEGPWVSRPVAKTAVKTPPARINMAATLQIMPCSLLQLVFTKYIVCYDP